MSGTTAIEWTDRTWNPLTGCTKVTPGCDHCYAKTMHERFNGPGSFDTVTLHPDRIAQPLRWRTPARVFVNSMSDLFHRDVPDEYIARVFATMAAAPQHTFQVLTKRHARLRALLSSERFDLMVAEAWSLLGIQAGATDDSHTPPWPLPNVWLGVSVENQQWADIRVPALLDTPAAVRFLSCEPLLGPLHLGRYIRCIYPPDSNIDWVIVGGESGPGARPMHPGWARSLRDQCDAAGVPFLFKQWGAWSPWGGGSTVCSVATDGRSTSVLSPPIEPGGYAMHLVGKKRAGRQLDGRTWDQYPAGAP